MHALPFALATTIAIAIAPATLRALTQGGHVRPNWRARELAVPFGVLGIAAALLALGPLALVDRLDGGSVFHAEAIVAIVYGLGVAMLGLIDDVLGGEARGWRGHAAALAQGKASTGVLKAAGSVGLAMFALESLALSRGRWLLASAVVVLATNAFNLLDLRPGRSSKALVLLGVGLTLGAWTVRPLWSLGLFVGPMLVAGVWDLRERAMLGDTGANLMGALAGLWLVFSLGTAGQLVALGLLVLVTVYGELRSISRLVERTPGLRRLDSWGRPTAQ